MHSHVVGLICTCRRLLVCEYEGWLTAITVACAGCCSASVWQVRLGCPLLR
jgi:hypothetical protein